MKCPACGKPVVTFLEFGTHEGLIASLTRRACPHCGRGVRPSRAVVASVLFLMAMVHAILHFSDRLCDRWGVHDRQVRLGIALGMATPALLLFGILAWRSGTYVARDPDDDPRGDPR